MNKLLLACLLLGGAANGLLPTARGSEIVLQSQLGRRASLLELYTSEGCSSCPPADAWLSALKTSPRLWKDLVPVAFHVDYWDNLGWKDRFASAAFTNRQRDYAAAWGTGTVYTPGFALDGREWEWTRGQVPEPAKTSPGVLTATVSDDRRTVSIAYRPAEGASAPREAWLAVVGCGLKNAVRAGENQGRELKHDFVALSCAKQPLAAASGNKSLRQTSFRLPNAPTVGAERYGVAVWVTKAENPAVEQATGGWVDFSTAPPRADRKTASANP